MGAPNMSTLIVTSGLPKASVLAPFLFLLYINNLSESAHSITRHFVNNCLKYSSIKKLDDTIIKQLGPLKLERWEKDCQMSFNPSKCEVLRVADKKTLI